MKLMLCMALLFFCSTIMNCLGVEATKPDNSELHSAILHGNLDVVKKAIQSGTNVDAVTTSDGMTALMDAIIQRQEGIAQFLMEKGANINATSSYAQSVLDAAITTTDPKMVKLILNHHPNLNYYEPTSALCHAIEIKNMEILKLLLDSGANPNIEELMDDRENAQSPLSLAVSKNDTEVMKLLIQHGANVNQPCSGRGGVTPIYDAILHGNIEAVQLLIDSKADLNFHTKSGDTPLKYLRMTTTHNPQVKANKEKIATILRAAGATE